MTLYVRTDYIPEDCDYLTVGKLYEVTDSSPAHTLAHIIDDFGDRILIRIEGICSHIDKEWEQVTLENELTVTLILSLEEWLALYRTIGEIQGIGMYLIPGHVESDKCTQIGIELQEKVFSLIEALQTVK